MEKAGKVRAATRKLWASAAIAMLLAGCSAFPESASAPTPTAPPTSAQVGTTSIIAIQPAAQPMPNLVQMSGIPQVGQALFGLTSRLVNAVRNRLGSRFPGLEAKPPMKSITDPANLDESAPPAVKVAAKVKADEDAAAQKIKGLRYLATIGCGGCYPDVEEALLAGLDDCTEEVRFEAAKALRSTVGNPCTFCKTGDCCSAAVRKKLRAIAYDVDATGCFEEPSPRVRRFARLALCGCGGTEPIEDIPTEGPGWDEETPGEGPLPAPTAVSYPSGEIDDDSAHDLIAGTGLWPSPFEMASLSGTVPAAFVEASPNSSNRSVMPATLQGSQLPHLQGKSYSMPRLQTPANVATSPNRIRSIATGAVPSSQATASTSDVYLQWEQVTVDPHQFESVERARQLILYIQAVATGKEALRPEFTANELKVERFSWTPMTQIRSQVFRQQLGNMQVGDVSPIVSQNGRWYLIRLLARVEK